MEDPVCEEGLQTVSVAPEGAGKTAGNALSEGADAATAHGVGSSDCSGAANTNVKSPTSQGSTCSSDGERARGDGGDTSCRSGRTKNAENQARYRQRLKAKRQGVMETHALLARSLQVQQAEHARLTETNTYLEEVLSARERVITLLQSAQEGVCPPPLRVSGLLDFSNPALAVDEYEVAVAILKQLELRFSHPHLPGPFPANLPGPGEAILRASIRPKFTREAYRALLSEMPSFDGARMRTAYEDFISVLRQVLDSEGEDGGILRLLPFWQNFVMLFRLIILHRPDLIPSIFSFGSEAPAWASSPSAYLELVARLGLTSQQKLRLVSAYAASRPHLERLVQEHLGEAASVASEAAEGAAGCLASPSLPSLTEDLSSTHQVMRSLQRRTQLLFQSVISFLSSTNAIFSLVQKGRIFTDAHPHFFDAASFIECMMRVEGAQLTRDASDLAAELQASRAAAQGYCERGYAGRGSLERDYPERGYAERDFLERDFHDRGHPGRSFQERGYQKHIQQERSYQKPSQQERSYQKHAQQEREYQSLSHYRGEPLGLEEFQGLPGSLRFSEAADAAVREIPARVQGGGFHAFGGYPTRYQDFPRPDLPLPSPADSPATTPPRGSPPPGPSPPLAAASPEGSVWRPDRTHDYLPPAAVTPPQQTLGGSFDCASHALEPGRAAHPKPAPERFGEVLVGPERLSTFLREPLAQSGRSAAAEASFSGVDGVVRSGRSVALAGPVSFSVPTFEQYVAGPRPGPSPGGEPALLHLRPGGAFDPEATPPPREAEALLLAGLRARALTPQEALNASVRAPAFHVSPPPVYGPLGGGGDPSGHVGLSLSAPGAAYGGVLPANLGSPRHEASPAELGQLGDSRAWDGACLSIELGSGTSASGGADSLKVGALHALEGLAAAGRSDWEARREAPASSACPQHPHPHAGCPACQAAHARAQTLFARPGLAGGNWVPGQGAGGVPSAGCLR